MGDIPDAPVVVLVATTVAAVLVLIEAALPTFGVAGASALALGFLAFAAADGGDGPWWPLLLVVAGVMVWAVALVTRHPASPVTRAIAAGLFAVGGVTYGVLASDPATVVVAAAASVTFPLVYPKLEGATRRLNELAPQLGMDAFVGRRAQLVRVDDADPNCGTVRLDGSFWNVHASAPLVVGAPVVVVSWSGMTLEVAPAAVADR